MFTMSFFIGVFIVLTFVIALIIKGGSKIIDTKDFEKSFATCVKWSMVISIVLTFASIFVSAVLMSGNYDYLKAEVEEKTIYEVYALKDNSSVKGKIFLGIGGIGESKKYTVMAKEQDGFVMKELDPKRTIVVEEENCDKPRYVERKTYEVFEKRDNLLSKVPTDFVKEDTKQKLADYSYILYIPKGSIKQGYEIDLE